MNKKYLYGGLATTLIIAVALFLVFGGTGKVEEKGQKVRYGISFFQDTLLPIFAEEKGWYKEEGLDVEIVYLEWDKVMPALASGAVDAAIINFPAFMVTYHKLPQEVVMFYPVFTFDKGLALIVRPNGRLKTLDEMMKLYPNDRERAVIETKKQLKGATVLTTRNTDTDQALISALNSVGLSEKDVNIIDIDYNQGLAAFLAGEGDVYIGGIAHRTRAVKEGMKEMLVGSDLCSGPINGIAARKDFAEEHPDAVLKLAELWFKSVRSINDNIETDPWIIINKLNSNTAASFTLDDFKHFWYELDIFPVSVEDAYEFYSNKSSIHYWRVNWDETNNYLVNVTKQIDKPVPDSAFWMEKVYQMYLKKYGKV